MDFDTTPVPFVADDLSEWRLETRQKTGSPPSPEGFAFPLLPGKRRHVVPIWLILGGISVSFCCFPQLLRINNFIPQLAFNAFKLGWLNR